MIEYLSFEGGGVKAYAYVGVMKYLSEDGVDLSELKVISGSSIGAFTALCIVLGYDWEEFRDILSLLAVPNFLNILTILRAIPNLFMKYGMINLSTLDEIVKSVFEKKNIDIDITFEEFYKLYPIHLIVTGSNVNTMRTIYFDKINTPQMKVRDAVKISISYPILFTPTIINKDYYCDGGLFRNLPFEYVEMEYEQHLKSIGFVLKGSSQVYQNSRNIIEYLLSLINGIYNNSTWSDYTNDRYIVDSRICQIPIPDGISSFAVTEEQKEELFENGYKAVELYFNKEKLVAPHTPHLT